MSKLKVTDLKKEIISEYIDSITEQIRINKKILSDNSWAATNTEYHRGCREGLSNETKILELKLKLLKK